MNVNPLKALKVKILENLNNSLDALMDENLATVMELKNNGIQYAVNKILELKSFKSLNLISYAFMLQSNNEEVKKKIESKNFEIYKACFDIDNDITYQKVIKKYFETESKFDVVNSLADIKYAILPIKFNDDSNTPDFEYLVPDYECYVNPYNNLPFTIESKNVGSKISTKKFIVDRTIKSTINIDVTEQYAVFSSSSTNYAGLINDFSINEINKFMIEFTLFHEMAHGSLTRYPSRGRIGEAISDICGVCRVIKNNKFTQEQAINYVNYIIQCRSNESPLQFHSKPITDQEESGRIHSTQFSLLSFKMIIEKNYNLIHNLSIEEELVMASRLSFAHLNSSVLKSFQKKHFDNIELYKEISLEKWLAHEKIDEYLQQLAKTRECDKQSLVDNIKTNVLHDPDKLFDIMTAYYAMVEPEELYKLSSYSYSIESIVRSAIFSERETAIDLDLEKNFSLKDVETVIDKQRKSKSFGLK